uniref:Uncharacterized protein n=1 Tax=Anguilla anguilla TaxID=7936 RepID=A0A0E9UKE5_ANGAN
MLSGRWSYFWSEDETLSSLQDLDFLLGR